jgi:quercetin dioxygenase-like cupin family protein
MLKKVLLCSALLLLVSGAFAQTQQLVAPGVTRTVLQQIDVPGGQLETVTSTVDFAPGAGVPLHTHFGVESAYVLEGEGILSVEGQPDRHLKAGDSFEIPANTPHKATNGSTDKPYRLLVTLVVDKGKPLTTIVQK